MSFSSIIYATTLHQVVIHALNHHPQVLAAQAQQLSTHYAIQQARGGYYPKISVRLAAGQEHSDNSFVRNTLGLPNVRLHRQENSVNLTQMLFDGGRVQSEVHQQIYNLKSADYQVVQNEQDIIFKAAEAYLSVLRARELIVLAKNNIYVHKQTLKQVQLRFTSGAGTKGEIELAKSRLALARIRLNDMIGLLEQAKARYLAIVGITPTRNLVKPKSLRSYLPANLRQAVDVALENNPLLNSAKAEVQSASAAVNVAKSNFFPRFNLELNASDNDNIDGIPGLNRDFSALFTMNYNVFNGGSDLAEINQAKSIYLQSRHTLQKIRRDIIEVISSIWSELKTNLREYSRQRTYVKFNKYVVKDYKQQFTLGKRALFNVLDAENELFRARVGLTNAYFDALINTYHLMASIGKLSPDIML